MTASSGAGGAAGAARTTEIQIGGWRCRSRGTSNRRGLLDGGKAVNWTFFEECIDARLGIEIEKVACRSVARGDHLFTLA